MPIYIRKEEVERLAQAELALNNASSDAPMLAALSQYAYDAVKLGAGLDLLKAVQEAVRTRDREAGEQYEATDTHTSVLMDWS